MSFAFRNYSADRQISKLGEPATLIEYAVSGQDAHGDDSYTTTSTEITVIPSTSTNTRLPFVRKGELGNYYMMQMEFFMSDAYETPNTAVDRPPVLVHDNLQYEITESENAKNGVVRLLGYRKRV